ncbi:MAG: AAA family ATPase [Desulfitobacterium sp.]
MKALKSVRLQNFQSHKNTLISFAGQGYLTVITGPSDSGKSAAIRALRWVFYNVPQGDGFIFNAEDKCTVTLEYEDGTKVERIRSRGGINRYVVSGQTFEGFGTGVPLEVQQATGIRKLEIGDQSFLLNLSEQLDGPFLGKSVSGPARAKVLGKLAGTEEIDFAGKEIGTDIYRSKREKEGLEKDIEHKKEQLGQYWFITAWEGAYDLASRVLNETKGQIAQIEKLKGLSAMMDGLNSEIKVLKDLVNSLKDLELASSVIDSAQRDLTKENTLTSLLGNYLQNFLGVEKLGWQVVRLDSLTTKLSSVLPKVTEAESQSSIIKVLLERYTKANESVNGFGARIKILSEIEVADSLMNQAEGISRNKQLVYGLSERYKDMVMITKSCYGVINSLMDVDLALNHLEQGFQENSSLVQLKGLQDRKLALYRDTSTTRANNGSLLQSIHEVEAEYLDYMSNLGKCPTCGGEIDVRKLKEVI